MHKEQGGHGGYGVPTPSHEQQWQFPPPPPEPSWTQGWQQDLGPKGCDPRKNAPLSPALQALPAQLGEGVAEKQPGGLWGIPIVPKLDDASGRVRSQISTLLCHTETFPISLTHI